MKMRLRTGLALGLSLLAALSGAQAWGQAGGKGTIQGTISDASGAIIPNAEISVTQASTSTVEKQKSTGAGFYSISSLDPGIYTVTVAVPGFQNYVQQNVRLELEKKVDAGQQRLEELNRNLESNRAEQRQQHEDNKTSAKETGEDLKRLTGNMKTIFGGLILLQVLVPIVLWLLSHQK